jgi:DNA-binding NarL/FixJ family response regulator
MPIRIFVYDDHQDRRSSLKALLDLQDEFLYTGDAPDCSNVLDDMEQYYPDVVLMDINMPVVDGLDGLSQIKTKYPEIKVLMQTAFEDDEKIFTSIKNGASGYILKRDRPQYLLQAITAVYEGGAVMNPSIALKVLDYFKPKSIVSPLSPREREVLALLADGLSYKMVADRLKLSFNTVNTHIRRIYDKLHLSSMGEAIAWYYKHRE